MTDASQAPLYVVDVAVGTGSRPEADVNGIFLSDALTKENLSLKNVSFDVQVEQGFADF